MEILFWSAFAVLIYSYLGYGVVLALLVRIKRLWAKPRSKDAASYSPEVTHLLAAYNEEAFIEEKLSNSLGLDYPEGQMKVWVVTDGSDDRTPELARTFEGVKVFHQPERRGKIAAVKRIMPMVDSPIVVFSDANTYLNKEAVQNLVRHFADPKVGAVAGEKRIYIPEESAANAAGEGIYWKYESFLKKMDAELYSVVGAAGELFAIRTDLFPEIPADTVIEDFYVTMKIAMSGYRVAYEDQAYAQETSSASVEEEYKRKVRISAGGFQAIVRLAGALNPFRYGWLTFQYISHRVLRWTLAPLSLILVLVANIGVVLSGGAGIYGLFLAGQILFYLLGGIGYLKRNEETPAKWAFVPFYFLMMNFSVFAGFRRYLKKSQSVVWEKARRAEKVVPEKEVAG